MPKGRRKYTVRNRCQICQHPERQRIELMHLAGVSLDRIAARFGVHRDSIWRHAENHMSPEEKAAILLGPAKLHDLIEATAEEAASLQDYYGIVRSVLFGQLMRLARENDHDGVAAISARIVHVLRDLARLTGELSTLTNSTIINVQSNTTIMNSAPFADLQGGLLRICSRHPEARRDIIELFRDLDQKYTAPQIEAAPMVEALGAAHA